jgi:hypothetical protein
VILRHLEYQNTMLIAMVQKLGIDAGAAQWMIVTGLCK